MDGLAFLRTVREKYPDLTFILFTGEGSESVAEGTIEVGVTSYRQKEGDTAQFAILARRIRTHVDQHRTREHDLTLQRKYELVAETATDEFWTADLQSESITFSDGLTNFGYESASDELAFDWWIERLHSDDRQRIRQYRRALLVREESAFDRLTPERAGFSLEYRIRRADGGHALRYSRAVLLFEDGEPVEMVGTMTDVTDHKEYEQTFRQRTQQLEAITETTDAAVFMVDPDCEHC